MDANERVTVVTETRNLRTLPFRPSEDQLSTSKAWEDWLEGIEREFRYFRITSAMDQKDALIIYGGQEIARLEKSLPDSEDSNSQLDVYQKLRKKLNEYFIPKIVCLFVCFTSQVNSYGHCGTVSSPNHTFSPGQARTSS